MVFAAATLVFTGLLVLPGRRTAVARRRDDDVPHRGRARACARAGLRTEHQVTVAVFRPANGAWQNAEASTAHRGDETLLVVGPTARVEAFAQLR